MPSEISEASPPKIILKEKYMKKLVHYAILDDMKKYIKDFDPNDYDLSYTGDTDPSVLKYARDYYASHLPVDVTAWVRVNKPNDNLIYKDGLAEQVCFVRDTLGGRLLGNYFESERNPIMVISTHTSKSVLLPVYQITLPKHGIEIILRYNFYDWKISIASEEPIECDFMGLFDEKQRIPAIYCEGFPYDKVYGSYAENHSKFTFEIGTNYDLYTLMFLLKKCLEH
jgi:hypothetical protein